MNSEAGATQNALKIECEVGWVIKVAFKLFVCICNKFWYLTYLPPFPKWLKSLKLPSPIFCSFFMEDGNGREINNLGLLDEKFG
jgi:hypothetical protein